MTFRIRRIDYYRATVMEPAGEGYRLLTTLAESGVNLLAFTAIPLQPTQMQLTLFPDDSLKLADVARKAGLPLDGPHPALLAQGDDELGLLASVHRRLDEAGANAVASYAVADGRGSFGYVLYLRPDQIDRASAALDL